MWRATRLGSSWELGSGLNPLACGHTAPARSKEPVLLNYPDAAHSSTSSPIPRVAHGWLGGTRTGAYLPRPSHTTSSGQSLQGLYVWGDQGEGLASKPVLFRGVGQFFKAKRGGWGAW